MDDAARQREGPHFLQIINLICNRLGEAGDNGARLLHRCDSQCFPAAEVERVSAAHRESVRGDMHAGGERTDGAAMIEGDVCGGDVPPLHEGNDRGGASGQRADRVALRVRQSARAQDAAVREVIGKGEVERQVDSGYAFFKQRQDEMPAGGVEVVVGVLNALPDSLKPFQRAEVIPGKEIDELVFVDLRINGHGARLAPAPLWSRGRNQAATSRGTLKMTFSVAVTTSSTVT